MVPCPAASPYLLWPRCLRQQGVQRVTPTAQQRPQAAGALSQPDQPMEPFVPLVLAGVLLVVVLAQGPQLRL